MWVVWRWLSTRENCGWTWGVSWSYIWSDPKEHWHVDATALLFPCVPLLGLGYLGAFVLVPVLLLAFAVGCLLVSLPLVVLVWRRKIGVQTGTSSLCLLSCTCLEPLPPPDSGRLALISDAVCTCFQVRWVVPFGCKCHLPSGPVAFNRCQFSVAPHPHLGGLSPTLTKWITLF